MENDGVPTRAITSGGEYIKQNSKACETVKHWCFLTHYFRVSVLIQYLI